MAVLDTYPSVKVQIKVNGAPLQEYDDDEEDSTPGTVVKYIEAITGTGFEIAHEITPRWPLYDILFKYFVDQHYTGGTFMKKQQYQGSVVRHTERGVTSRKDGQEFLHTFQFAALSIGELTICAVRSWSILTHNQVEAGTETPKHDDRFPKTLKDLGQIRVQAFHVHNLRPHANVRDKINPLATNFGPLPEKALKGRTLSHHAA
jgi:hypothetical protein